MSTTSEQREDLRQEAEDAQKSKCDCSDHLWRRQQAEATLALLEERDALERALELKGTRYGKKEAGEQIKRLTAERDALKAELEILNQAPAELALEGVRGALKCSVDDYNAAVAALRELRERAAVPQDATEKWWSDLIMRHTAPWAEASK